MLKLAAAAIAGMLFLLLYFAIRTGLEAWWGRRSRRQRLRSRAAADGPSRLERELARFRRPYAHVADMLTALGWRIKPDVFAGLSALLALAGVAGGVLLFAHVRATVLLALMLGLLPYCALRMRLISRQMAVRLDFLPAVELFYQCYLVTGGRHVRTALQKTVEERRLPGEIQAVFDQLCRHLSVRGNDEESIRLFALSVGHVWADYFGSILLVSLTEGNSVGDSLRELIADMRRAQIADQRDRYKLLEIRLANYAPALFLALFVGLNFRLNPDGSRLYYLLDPVGRDMLLHALVLLFASLLMGFYLSRRKL